LKNPYTPLIYFKYRSNPRYLALKIVMAIELTKHQLLEKTENRFENLGVFNPGVFVHDGKIKMLYRATTVGNYSSFGYAELINPTTIAYRKEEPFLVPTAPYESAGIEDPRIVKIDDCYYITYTAYNGTTAFGALMTTYDFVNFEKRGVLTPQMSYKEFQLCLETCEDLNSKYLRFARLFHKRVSPILFPEIMLWDKDICFFPRKINGKFALLHRIYPDIQIVYFDYIEELTYEFWKSYLCHLHNHILISGKYDFESSYVGSGCPPIETKEGWLLIYHGVQDTPKGYVYSAGAALFDLNNPLIEIGRLKTPLIEPELDWEKEGVTPNVVFPVSAILENDQLTIYYGAADKCIALTQLSLTALIIQITSTENQ
jgi:predicted GH43/DUF377 family glycosyl hydrolase